MIGEDRQQIEAFYHDQGYVRVKVGMPDIKISKDGKTISISIPLKEGDLYKVGKIDFKGDLLVGDPELRKKLKSKTGATFRSSLSQADITSLTDLYQDKGYAFTDIAPLTAINDDEKTVDLLFDIAQGTEVYFNRINIIGNSKTRDKVIRPDEGCGR